MDTMNRVEKSAINSFGKRANQKLINSPDTDKWVRQRQKALIRDGYNCAECGMAQEEHKDKYGMELHVHHNKPRRQFDRMELAHKLSNLICLCAECHIRVENETE